MEHLAANIDANEKMRSKPRIDLRLEPTQKNLLEAAAAILGQSLTSFLLSNSLQAAQVVIHEHQATRLSLTDSKRFIEILENPVEPNQSLIDAAQLYKESITSSHGL